MLSRSADSLYWLGRYMERSENTIRLLRVRLNLMVGQAAQVGNDRGWQQFFAALHLPPPLNDSGEVDNEAALLMAHDLTFNRENESSISGCISLARENARFVRSRLSSQLWEHMNRLYLRLHSWQGHHNWHDERDNFFRELENSVSLFQGLAFASLLHDEGWYFIQLGAHLERVLSVCGLLRAHFRYFGRGEVDSLATEDQTNGIGILRACNSFEAYCRVYDPMPDTRTVTSFLLLDPHLPNSVRFNVDQMAALLTQIAEATESRRAGEMNRMAGKLQAHLKYTLIEEVNEEGPRRFLSQIVDTCDQIHAGLYAAYINYPAEEALN